MATAFVDVAELWKFGCWAFLQREVSTKTEAFGTEVSSVHSSIHPLFFSSIILQFHYWSCVDLSTIILLFHFSLLEQDSTYHHKNEHRHVGDYTALLQELLVIGSRY